MTRPAGVLEGDRLPIDLAANAPQSRRPRHRGPPQAELEQAIKEAKAAPADRPVVIHVETDPLVHAPDSASWGRPRQRGVRARLDPARLRRVPRPQGHATPSSLPPRPARRPHREARHRPLHVPRDAPARAAGPRRRARLRVDRAEPREDFTLLQPLPGRRHRRRGVPQGARRGRVGVASVLPLYTWSGPDEEDRQAAVRYWKRAIQIASDLGVDTMNSEFNGNLASGSSLRADVRRSMDERLRLREGGPACARAASGRLGGGRQASRRPDPRHQQRQRVLPLLRAAHLPPGQRLLWIMDKAATC